MSFIYSLAFSNIHNNLSLALVIHIRLLYSTAFVFLTKKEDQAYLIFSYYTYSDIGEIYYRFLVTCIISTCLNILRNYSFFVFDSFKFWSKTEFAIKLSVEIFTQIDKRNSKKKRENISIYI